MVTPQPQKRGGQARYRARSARHLSGRHGASVVSGAGAVLLLLGLVFLLFLPELPLEGHPAMVKDDQ